MLPTNNNLNNYNESLYNYWGIFFEQRIITFTLIYVLFYTISALFILLTVNKINNIDKIITLIIVVVKFIYLN